MAAQESMVHANKLHASALLLVIACGGQRNDDPFATGTETNPTTTAGAGTVTSSTVSTTGSGSDDGQVFDLAIPDLGGIGGGIPTTCAGAEAAETTVGCLFYAVDLDQNGGLEFDQFAISVSNVQTALDATVTVETKVGGQWMEAAGAQNLAPLELFAFDLPDLHQDGSGVLAGGAYRVVSDVPIVAYQFNPLIAGAFSSDASMLYPVASWDTINQVVGWGGGSSGGYITIAAAFDGTQVEVVPSVTTAAGPGVSAGTPGVPLSVSLDEGDILEVASLEDAEDLTGTIVTTNDDHPVAVFSGHPCSHIPDMVIACDHVEDQLAGVRLWGTEFVAARVPVRDSPDPEASLWQIYASEDDTEVTITASAGVTGLPASPATLQRGEMLEFYAAGPVDEPGDFVVAASKPIAVVNYMTGRGNLISNSDGDPAMVQLSPIEQFLDRYVILVPSQWETDMAVITREAGAEIRIDDVAVSDAEFLPVGTGHEVARVAVADGVHRLDGDAPFSIVIVGFDLADSYAYLGGTGTFLINPNPEG